MNRSIATIAAFALLATAGGAHAQTVDGDVKAVSYARSDLHSAEQVRVLYGRLKRAARDVCAAPSGIAGIADAPSAAACRKEALARAVAMIGHERLNAMHQQPGVFQVAAR